MQLIHEPANPAPPVEVLGLQKSYGGISVLRGVGFRLEPGQLVGFLGSNGAGKTTTLRILLGLIQASSGTARVFGQTCRPQTAAWRKNLGYLPGEVSFYPWLKGITTLCYYAGARGIDCRAEIARLAELFQLDLAKPVRKYSTGMKQKLGLIQALMHRPRLLILDEPTNGLDPLIRQSLMGELRSLAAAGGTVLFSSHTLGEVDELCDRVIILRNGMIIEDQPMAELRKRSIRRVELTSSRAAEIAAGIPPDGHLLASSPSQLEFTWTGPLPQLLEWLQRHPCEDILIGKPSLDDLFMTHYRKEAGVS